MSFFLVQRTAAFLTILDASVWQNIVGIKKVNSKFSEMPFTHLKPCLGFMKAYGGRAIKKKQLMM